MGPNCGNLSVFVLLFLNSAFVNHS